MLTMTTTTLSSKGQIVIPREIRERHGWKPGTVMQVEDRDDCLVIRLSRAFARTTVDDPLGCLPYDGEPKTLAEMDEGRAKGEPGRADEGT